MRRLKSKHEERKKQKRNQLVIGIILMVVMFGSVFGVIVNSFGKDESSTKIVYNGYEFINKNDLWYLSLGDYDFVFKYNPEEVDKSESEINYLTSYLNEPLYISSENYESALEIYRNLNPVVERTQEACFEGLKCEGDLPVKTCEDNFIIIQEKENMEIKQEDNCVFIYGEKENLTKITDEFLFKIIGVE